MGQYGGTVAKPQKCQRCEKNFPSKGEFKKHKEDGTCKKSFLKMLRDKTRKGAAAIRDTSLNVYDGTKRLAGNATQMIRDGLSAPVRGLGNLWNKYGWGGSQAEPKHSAAENTEVNSEQ